MTQTDIDVIAEFLYNSGGERNRSYASVPSTVRRFYRRMARAVLTRWRLDDLEMSA